MQHRYRIENDVEFIEVLCTRLGELFLKGIRKNGFGFKHKRIKDVIQAHPDKVELGVRHKKT